MAIRLSYDATLPVVSNRAPHQENDMITIGLRCAGTMPWLLTGFYNSLVVFTVASEKGNINFVDVVEAHFIL